MVLVRVCWFRKNVHNLKWTFVHSNAKKPKQSEFVCSFSSFYRTFQAATFGHTVRPGWHSPGQLPAAFRIHFPTFNIGNSSPSASVRFVGCHFKYLFAECSTSNPVFFSHPGLPANTAPESCCCVDKLSCWYVSVGRCVRVSSQPQKYTHFWPSERALETGYVPFRKHRTQSVATKFMPQSALTIVLELKAKYFFLSCLLLVIFSTSIVILSNNSSWIISANISFFLLLCMLIIFLLHSFSYLFSYLWSLQVTNNNHLLPV